MGYGFVGKTMLQNMRLNSWNDEEEREAPRRRRRRHVEDEEEEEAPNAERLHEILNNLSVRMDAMVERFTAQFDDLAHQIEQWRDEVKPICRIACDFFAQNPDLVPRSVGKTTLQNMNTVREDDGWWRLNALRDGGGEAPEVRRVRGVEEDVRDMLNGENLQERVNNLSLRAEVLEGHFHAQLDKLDQQIRILGDVKPFCRIFSTFMSQNPQFLPLLNN